MLTSGKIVEDVVDAKPWYFEDVESLILGSIHGAADIKGPATVDDPGKASSSATTVRNPSPAPSSTSGTNLDRKANDRVSRFSKFLGRDP